MAALINSVGRLVVASLAVATLTACGPTTTAPTVTVTVPPSTPATPTSSPSGTPSATAPGLTAAPSLPGVSSSAGSTTLQGTCETLLPQSLVAGELGKVTLSGPTAFVVGVPDKQIGRLSTINCRYGVSGSGATTQAQVEIGVSLYSTPAQAATRINATVDDYRAHGAAATQTPVGRLGGELLTGGVGSGYDQPLLVLATDRRTIAVTIDADRLKAVNVEKASVALAALAAKRTQS